MATQKRLALAKTWATVVCVAQLLIVGYAPAQDPSKTDPKTPAAPAQPETKPATSVSEKGREKAKTGTGLDAISPPPGSIIIICEDMKEAARLAAKAVLLTPEEYQRLSEQSEQARQRNKVSRPINPSVCRVAGKIDAGVAKLHAIFEFVTDRPGVLVQLGCQRAWPSKASLDGELPALLVGEEGFIAQVPKAGKHVATLDLLVPISTRRDVRGNDRGFDLDLPRAAISMIDTLDFSSNPVEIRLGSRTVRTQPVDGQWSRLENTPIAPIDHLDLAWKGPVTQSAGAPPVQTVDAHVVIRVTDAQVITEAEFVLQSLGGAVSQWNLRAPALTETEAEVRAIPADEARVRAIEMNGDKRNPVWSIRLKEPSMEPLQIRLRTRQPRTSELTGIGPFLVPEAQIQKGEIEIRVGEDARLRCVPAPELSRREIGDEQRRNDVRAAFAYWNVPASADPNNPPQPLLQFQVLPLKGAAEARALHTLRIIESDLRRQPRVQVTSRFEIKPIRTRVDHVSVTMPAEFQLDRTVGAKPAEMIEDLILDPQRKIATFKLAQKQDRPFTLTIEGAYLLPAGARTLALDLPRPSACGLERTGTASPIAESTLLQIPLLDRGGQLTVSLPEGLELNADNLHGSAVADMTGGLTPFLLPWRSRFGTREYNFQTDRLPDHIELAWRPRGLDSKIESTVDIALEARTASITQNFRFRIASGVSSQIDFRVPLEIGKSARILSGGVLSNDWSASDEVWRVRLDRSPTNERSLLLQYRVDLETQEKAEPGEAATEQREQLARIPIVQPTESASHEIKVRIWAEGGTHATVVGESWSELPTEVVPGHERLPVCVASAANQVAVAVRIQAPADQEKLVATIVDRALANVGINPNGTHAYNVRFVVDQAAEPFIDVDMPVPMVATSLDARMNDQRLPVQMIDDDAKEINLGRVARLFLDRSKANHPFILGLRYQYDPSRIDGNGVLRRVLEPPMLRRAVFLGRARWQIAMPSGSFPIVAGQPGETEATWSWRQGLFAPVPAASTSDIEKWLTGRDPETSAAAAPSTLLYAQEKLEPLTFWQVSERGWVLGCSVCVLLAGLIGYFSLHWRWAWLTVGVCVVLLGLAGLFQPALLRALAYGTEPGLATLALLAAAAGALYAVDRRGVARAPGFSRSKQGSSLVVPAVNGTPREPTTHDHLPKRGSSVSSELRA